MFGDAVSEDILEKLRNEKVINNDRWQSCTFRDTHCGESAGLYEIYAISSQQGSNQWAFPLVESGNVHSEILASKYDFNGVNVTFRESYDPDYIGENGYLSGTSLTSLRSPTRSLCRAIDFRPSKGNQVVGGAFTFCSVCGDGYLSEIAILEGPVRTRVRYLFAAPSAAEYNLNPDLIEGDADYSLVGFTVIRERFIGQRSSLSLPPFDPFRGGQVGRGIYDPQEGGEPYVELRFPGLLTLFFPRYLQAGKSASLTMEWWGDNMRYQVDRRLSGEGNWTQGEIKSLELTEVTIEDSNEYPALFPPSPEFL
eukprot:gene32311-43156_t